MSRNQQLDCNSRLSPRIPIVPYLGATMGEEDSCFKNCPVYGIILMIPLHLYNNNFLFSNDLITYYAFASDITNYVCLFLAFYFCGKTFDTSMIGSVWSSHDLLIRIIEDIHHAWSPRARQGLWWSSWQHQSGHSCGSWRTLNKGSRNKQWRLNHLL